MADNRFNSDIVQGLNSFEPVLLLVVPVDQATFCFSALYHSFNLRGLLANVSDVQVRDEYLEVLDHFRKNILQFERQPETFTDVVDFVDSNAGNANAQASLLHLQLGCFV